MTHKFDALGQVIEARVQVGICHFGLIQSSDQLINTAERTARNARTAVSGVMLFKPQSSAEALREERIITLLSETGEDSRLSHVYQPIVAVAGGDEKQFQTLLRLRMTMDGRLTASGRFIPIAEKSNLVIALDRWSIAKAAETLSHNATRPATTSSCSSVNRTTLLEPGQIAWMKNLLKAVPNRSPTAAWSIEIRSRRRPA